MAQRWVYVRVTDEPGMVRVMTDDSETGLCLCY